VLIALKSHEIRGIEDLMFVLNASKPGERAQATVLRDGKPLRVEVVFQASQGRR
jgi:S1-C subfamily serine protease